MKSKIVKSEFTKEWGEGFNKVYYHNVNFEGDDTTYNIGAKKQNPDFLAVGKTLEYEITDEAKHKIKRSKPDMNRTAATSPSSSGSGGYKKKTTPTVDANSKALIRHLDNFNESDLIFIDIETVRAVKDLKPDTPLYEAWEYKNRYNNELEKKTGEKTTLEEYFNDKAALYATFAKVVVIVVGRIVDGQLKTKKYAVSKETKWDESVLLKEFNDDVNAVLSKNPNAVFVGWANKSFDQPFLAKRMYVHRIQPNILLDVAHLKPWEIPGFDLKELWQGAAYYPDSLIAAAVALSIPSPKSNMDGSKVGEAYYAGKIEDIATYCELDVLTETNVYRVLAGKPLVTLK